MEVLPIPPKQFRQMVGPVEEHYFDNPSGELIWGDLSFDPLKAGEAYQRVLDFGCGCGRDARRLMLQETPPEDYVGIDINKELINWCDKNLSNSKTRFYFHDVWARTAAPNNSRNSKLPIRQHGDDFTVINAHSVFTHLYSHQTEFYLSEFGEMLSQKGIIRSTWFLFNRDWFPVLNEQQHCIYVNELDPTHAVYYDWGYLVRLFAELEYRIVGVNWTKKPGFQSVIYLAKDPAFEDLIGSIRPPDSILGFGKSTPRVDTSNGN